MRNHELIAQIIQELTNEELEALERVQQIADIGYGDLIRLRPQLMDIYQRGLAQHLQESKALNQTAFGL